MSILDTIGSVLSAPRDAAWNLIRSGKNAITGEGTWDDALRAIPGALGTGLGAALTATGVGAPLGILAGSVLGGLGQGVGSAADEAKFQAPTAQDVTGSDNPLLNTLVSVAGDPLTYAGLGAMRGAGAAGEAVSPAARLAQYVASDAAAPGATTMARGAEGGGALLDALSGASAAPAASGDIRLALQQAGSVFKPTEASGSVVWPGTGTQFGDDLSFLGRNGGKFQIRGKDLGTGDSLMHQVTVHSLDNPATEGMQGMAHFEPLQGGGGYVASDLLLPPEMRGHGLAQAMYDAFQQHYGNIHRSLTQTDAGAAFWDKVLRQAGR